MAEKQNSQPDPDALGGPDGSTAGDAQAFDEQEQDAVESALAEAQASIREIQAAAEGAGGRDAAEGTLVSNAQASAAADAAMAAMMMGAGDDATSVDPSAIDLLGDVELQVMVELGRTQMMVEDVLRLGGGAVVELDKLAGDPVDVYVNNRLVARGEVLVLNDNFCIRISEIVADLEQQAQAAARQEAGA